MTQTKERLKYPLYLFISILFLKLGYIFIESYYNYYVLSITTSESLTKETLDSLNINGHRISATGITLLIIPFLYFIASRFFKENVFSFLVIFSMFIYFIAYESLNTMVDKIVEVNKERRHDAYYVNVFKYGILNKIFVYDSFIDSKKIANDAIEVDDRILLTNTFLLLHSDAKLIPKLKERGRIKIADLYIDKQVKEDFLLKKKSFEEASKDISLLFNEINKNKKELKKQLDKLNEVQMQEAYILFVKSLKQAYFDYKTAWANVHEKIAQETSDARIERLRSRLEYYFKFKRFKRVQKKYVENVFKHFGHFVHPNDWKDINGEVSKERIKYVIRREIMLKVNDNLKKFPDAMNIEEFLYHYESRFLVMKKLNEYDILVPYDFNYSAIEFYKYFTIMAEQKHQEAYETFYTRLEKKIGKNDIKLSMNWEEFIYSDFIKMQIQTKVELDDAQSTKNLLKALYSKDLSNFRELVYKPYISNQVKEMSYNKEDFRDGAVASSYGDDAIKLLYIPPFALSISIIALLLNMFTVIGMLMLLVRLPFFLRFVLKITLIASIIFVPMYYKTDTINANLLKQPTEETKMYLNFLAWISYYQKHNSLLHESNLIPKLEEIELSSKRMYQSFLKSL